MRLEAAQYRELAAFAQFGSDLDAQTQAKLERGRRLMEIFKQDQYEPRPVATQVLIFFALINGLLDDVPSEKISQFESGLNKYAAANGKEILKEIAEKKDLNEGLERKMRKLVEDAKMTVDCLVK